MTHFGEHSDSGGSSDTTGASGQTVGFRYFMGIHMGICRGPVDELVEIRVGDRTAWASVPGQTVLYTDGNKSFAIDAYDLFGGEGGEGGIKGTLDVMFGAQDQVCSSNLADMLDGIVSGNAGSVPDKIGLTNQTITGVSGDTYVGLKMDSAGWAYKTSSSTADTKLDRPWSLAAPYTYHGRAGLGSFSYNVRFHAVTTGTLPTLDGRGMALDRFYNLGGDPREFRLTQRGSTVTFLISWTANGGIDVGTAVITLTLPA